MSEQSYSWTPPQGLTNHADVELKGDIDLFAPPPDEIGEVLSANSTLKQGTQPWALATRLALGFMVGSILGVIAFFAIMLIEGLPEWMFIIGAIGFGAGCLITVLVTGFSHTCTYVGREGCARFKCSGNRDNISSTEIFCFRNATELRTSQVRRYVNGACQGTNYTFTWSDGDGRTRYTISGTHNSEKGTPPPKDAYHYASAAELAWSHYLLQMVPDQLKKHDAIYFSLGGSDWVRVGAGFLDLCVRGETTHCDANDIASVHLDKGIFTIKRTDAKEGWFSSKGVFKFNYGNLANAQLFAFVVDKLAGVRIF
jgi:F0F1-type ATP synthase assembly protein I